MWGEGWEGSMCKRCGVRGEGCGVRGGRGLCERGVG